MSSIPDRKSRLTMGNLPVMRETKYDLTASLIIAVATILSGTVILLVAIWLSNQLPNQTVNTPIMFAGEGGFEDGTLDATLDVESPEDLSNDASLSNDQQDTQLQEILDRMLTASSDASQLELPNEFTDLNSGGNPGSADGVGGKPLGTLGGLGGKAREERWFIEFADGGDLRLYAQQLDFFGIELGVAWQEGRIVYISDMSTTAVLRESRITEHDGRLFFNWQGGNRIKADRELLKRAGVDNTAEGTILHFYPAATEQLLADLEKSYRGRPSDQIRSTHFLVEADGTRFRFRVISQKYR